MHPAALLCDCIKKEDCQGASVFLSLSLFFSVSQEEHKRVGWTCSMHSAHETIPSFKQHGCIYIYILWTVSTKRRYLLTSCQVHVCCALLCDCIKKEDCQGASVSLSLSLSLFLSLRRSTRGSAGHVPCTLQMKLYLASNNIDAYVYIYILDCFH